MKFYSAYLNASGRLIFTLTFSWCTRLSRLIPLIIFERQVESSRFEKLVKTFYWSYNRVALFLSFFFSLSLPPSPEKNILRSFLIIKRRELWPQQSFCGYRDYANTVSPTINYVEFNNFSSRDALDLACASAAMYCATMTI